jgi:hypothetical protein
MSDFIPKKDAKLVGWAINYKTILAEKAAELGITPEQVAAQKLLCDNTINAIGAAVAAKGTYESAITHKNQTVTTDITSVRDFVKDIKRSPTYTEAIGNQLGIVGTPTTMDNNSYKSSLKPDVHPGYVALKFTKKGAEGINLYARKSGEVDWQKLGFYAHSPCIDARPLAVAAQAENREYMCIGVAKDHEIGLQSDIVSVAFAG